MKEQREAVQSPKIPFEQKADVQRPSRELEKRVLEKDGKSAVGGSPKEKCGYARTVNLGRGTAK